MKVPFVHGPGDLRLDEVDLPAAGSRDVVLRVGTVGICGTDLGYLALGGTTGPTARPIPLGHELSGTVMEIGAEVTAFEVGQRVVVNPLVNMIGNGGAEGAFAERLLIRDVVANPASLLALPAKLSFDHGALVEPLAVATHGVDRLGAQPGDKIALFGAGPIGLASIVVLRHRGIEDVVVFDLSPFRRLRAEQLGARGAFDPLGRSPSELLQELHGATKVFGSKAPQTTHYLEASGAPIIPDIVGMARNGATICVVSIQKKPATIDFMTVMSRELTLTGAFGYPSEFDTVLRMLDEGGIDLEPMISHRFEGDDVLSAFETAHHPGEAAKVLVQYDRRSCGPHRSLGHIA